ncbi:exosome catalytic subunit dis3 [Ordospora colligata]|uniref:Ribosomal RNA-processing protein 44 n=1 Tax=Ordospora colligata OC4 TaxID=1354746 RepID=A0A0B2UGA7_9MICR|nr:exoribonuclease R [Ordospora colligata OC4]KHN70116.1 exoribonuclease R [Ordospora colligata OC4]TBU16683.1 exoribonuclease R [Ordospora colligata]
MWKDNVSERRISKRLKLVKRTKERYVRSEVPCGFECCGAVQRKRMRAPVFIIPDAYVVSRYWALLQSDYVEAIICQSVLEELSIDDRKRLRALMREKQYILFYDNFCKDTSGKGLMGVLEYYVNHVREYTYVILDKDSVKEYGKYVSKDISDMLVNDKDDDGENYEEYKTNLDVLYGSGEVYRGVVEISLYNCYSGVVIDGGVRINVIGKENMNRALHGDEVYVEVIDERGDDTILIDEEIQSQVMKNECEAEEKIEVNALANMLDNNRELYGKIVGIYKRKTRSVIGSVPNDIDCKIRSQYVLMIPIDRRMPTIRVRTLDAQKLKGKRLCVEIDTWENTSKYPSGCYYRELGDVGDKDVEIESLLLANRITYYGKSWDDFDVDLNAFNECESMKRINEEVMKGLREDFRNFLVLSIDPPGCTDIDDALHSRNLANGNIEVGVHIADVTFYVGKGSGLDEVAKDRCTSVYLPEMRIDMLPAVLSTNLCSLVEGKERAVFSVVWEVSMSGEIISTRFCRSVIKSRRAMSYEEANNIINEKRMKGNEIQETLNRLNGISKILRKKRFEKGSLDMSTRDVVFRDGKLEFKESYETNLLVEELMILANISTAMFTYHYYPEASLLRRHPPPNSVPLGFHIDASSVKALNESILRLDENHREMAKRTLIRSMNQAVYFLSGDVRSFHHYGLGTDMYTHFTSPIRRYADIVVHRILGHILSTSEQVGENISGLGRVEFTPIARQEEKEDDVFADEKSCNNMNRRHRSAQRASWECEKLAIYMALRDAEPTLDGYITGIRSNGVIIYVPDYNIEEAVLCSTQLRMFEAVRVRVMQNDQMFFFHRRFSLKLVD